MLLFFAHSNQSRCEAFRCTQIMRLSKAEDIGLTMALSDARFPAPITIEPAGR
jgi:hypothetical protein